MNRVIILSACILASLGLIGYTGYNYGYNRAAHKYLQEEQARQQKLQLALNELQSSLNGVATTVSASEEASEADLKEILARLKKSPVTVVKNGKCTPAPTFLNSIDDAVNRANTK